MRNRFHALCPYFAMFPEGFAEKWINELTDPGDLVVDRSAEGARLRSRRF